MSYDRVVRLLNYEFDKGNARTRQFQLTTTLLQRESLGDPIFHISFNPNTPPSNPTYDLGPVLIDDFSSVHRLASDRVTYALSAIFNRPENRDLQFHCSLSDVPNHLNLAGMEITVFHAPGSQDPFRARSTEEWKAIMLTCWLTLVDLGVQDIGYVYAVGANPIQTEEGLFSPFSSSSVPLLENVVLTAEDLAEHGIPLTWSARIIHTRMNYPGRKQAVKQEWAAHVLREKESLKVFITILGDENFWIPKHSKETSAPKGIAQAAEHGRALLPLDVKTNADIELFWEKCKKIAESRPPRNRDSMTKSAYKIFLTVNPRLGTLTLNPHFKRLKRAYDCWKGESETVVEKMQLVQKVLAADWSDASPKKKEPKAIHKLKKTGSPFNPQNASSKERNEWLRELQSVAHTQRRKPEFLRRQDPLAYQLCDALDGITDMADLEADTKIQEVMDQLRPQ